ncbi:MAG: FTR1 family protein [Chloroflexi bacterium]|nr:FTR1 family protein [Chloroflexota bacterium]
MLPSYLLSLREGIEAALIVGILLGAVRQMKRTDLITVVWLGTLSAGALSILTAVLLTTFGLEMKDPGEAIFEGFTMLIAAGLLTWMIFWMSRQARFLKTNLEAEIHQASKLGQRAIFFVAFVAVLREGIELALFLTASVFVSTSLQTTVGAFLGLGTAILLGWSIFASTVRLDLRRFFQVTGVMLVLFAAGLFAHGVHEFTEVGWIPAIIDPVWDFTSIISKESILGQLLSALFGYNPSPTLSEMIAYVAYFVTIGIGLQWAGQRPRKEAQAQA